MSDLEQRVKVLEEKIKVLADTIALVSVGAQPAIERMDKKLEDLK